MHGIKKTPPDVFFYILFRCDNYSQVRYLFTLFFLDQILAFKLPTVLVLYSIVQ
jgi:hypothetical protein